jgi:hypothetical protein
VLNVVTFVHGVTPFADGGPQRDESRKRRFGHMLDGTTPGTNCRPCRLSAGLARSERGCLPDPSCSYGCAISDIHNSGDDAIPRLGTSRPLSSHDRVFPPHHRELPSPAVGTRRALSATYAERNAASDGSRSSTTVPETTGEVECDCDATARAAAAEVGYTVT